MSYGLVLFWRFGGARPKTFPNTNSSALTGFRYRIADFVKLIFTEDHES